MEPNQATELAALQAQLAAKDAEILALKAEDQSEDLKAAVAAKDTELADAKRKVEDLERAGKERQARDAEATVQSAVARGAIGAKDETVQRQWRDLIVADPKNSELLARLPGKLALTAGRIVRPAIETLKADIADAMRGYVAAATPADKGWIYRKEFRDILEKGDRIPWERSPIAATDTLVGNIISQRTLDLIVSRRPMLLNVTTDFSSEQARLNQTVYTRTVPIPSVASFGSGAAAPTATDYTVALSNHVEVHYGFAASSYLGSNRDLVAENAQAMATAIGNSMVDAVWDLITDAFTSETTGAAAGKDFSAITAACKALNTAGAPDFGRTMWINSDFAEALSNDELIMQYLDNANRTAYGHWRNIKGFDDIWEFPAGDGNSITLIGFAFQRSALLLATRVADDPSRLIGAGYPGVLQVISDPVTGFSLLSDRWITQSTRVINTRLDVLYGAARGVVAAGHKFVTS